MDFLKENSSLIIIQSEPFKTTILKVNRDSFEVKKENLIIDDNKSIECIIKNPSNVITFKTIFLGENDKTILFQKPKKHSLIQRREYNRVNIKLPAEIEDENENDYLKCETENISGGGMKVVVKTDKSLKKLLNIKLHVLNKQTINAVLKVLRFESDKTEKNKFLISGSFEKIKGEDRTTLIHLCFKQGLETKCKNQIISRRKNH